MVHAAALMMPLLSEMNRLSRMMHLPKVYLFLFRLQSVGGEFWKKFSQMNHPVSFVHIENDLTAKGCSGRRNLFKML